MRWLKIIVIRLTIAVKMPLLARSIKESRLCWSKGEAFEGGGVAGSVGVSRPDILNSSRPSALPTLFGPRAVAHMFPRKLSAAPIGTDR